MTKAFERASPRGSRILKLLISGSSGPLETPAGVLLEQKGRRWDASFEVLAASEAFSMEM